MLRVIDDAPVLPPLAAPAVLAKGFRPFFLLGSGYGALAVVLWLAQLQGLLTWRPALAPMLWHGHEMLFGFTTAVVAGFLLTAVPNWTGRPTPVGAPLGALVALWVLGRVVTLMTVVPTGLAALLDGAFLPALAVALAAPLVRAGKPGNLVFLPILAIFAVGNALIWTEALGWTRGTAATGLEVGLFCTLMLIAVIGGRVLPFFIRAALPQSASRSWPWVERVALGTLPLAALAPVLAWIPAVAHTVRLVGWHDRRLWRVPLLWVLYLGYAWLPIGLALRASGAHPFAALHALTAGCIGMLILGMMARVALGHTGRALKAPAPVALAFGLLGGAACLRTFGPLLAPGPLWVPASGIVWTVAFGLFWLVYFPILTRPRADGKPG